MSQVLKESLAKNAMDAKVFLGELCAFAYRDRRSGALAEAEAFQQELHIAAMCPCCA